MMVPSGKLIDKCPREGCGFTFGEHRDDCAESPQAAPVRAASVGAPVAPVPAAPVAAGTASLIAGLELRLAELDSEASMIRRMLRAAAEGVH